MTQDLYFIESGYLTPDSGYFVYIADAESAVSSSATMSATCGVIKQGATTMVATSTVSSTISHIEGADLFALSDSELAAEVQRIRDNNIEVSSAFTQVVAGSKYIHFGSEQYADSDISIDNLRVRYNEAAVNAAFSLAADVEKIAGGTTVSGSGDWNSQFTIDTVAYKTTNIDVDSNVSFEQTIDGQRIRFGSSSLSSEFTSSTNINNIASGYSDLSSTATLSAACGIIKQGESFENALFTPSIDCVAIRNSFAVLESTTSVNISSTVNKPFNVDCTATSSVSAFGVVNKEYSSTLSNQASVNCDAVRTIVGSSSISSKATVSATPYRIKQFASAENALFTPSIDCVAIRNSFAVLDNVSTLSSIVFATKSASSSLSSGSSISLSITKFRGASSNLSSQFTQLVPYTSFTNKRPHSAYYRSGAGVSGGITDVDKKYGTYSYRQQENTGSGTLGFYVPWESGQRIYSNDDFYVSIWTKWSVNVSQSGIYKNILTWTDGNTFDTWGFGVYYGAGYVSPYFYYYNNLTLVRLIATDPTYGNAEMSSTWSRWEAFRSGSTITFRFTASGGLYPNYAFTKTSTYSGGIGGSSGEVYLTTPVAGSSGSTDWVYFDEFFFAKGVSSVQSTNADGSIADGANSTTQWLFNFENNYQDTTTGIQKVSSALSSTASISINANKSVVSISSLTCTATEQVIISRIRPGLANLQSTGSTVITVGRIKPFASLEDVQFNLSINPIIVSTTSAALSCSSALAVTITKNIGTITSNISSTFNLTANAVATDSDSANLTSSSSLEITPKKFVGFSSSVSSASSITVSAQKVLVGNSTLTSSSSLELIITKFSRTSVSLSSNSSLSVDVRHTIPFAALLASSGTLSATGKIYKSTQVSISSVSTLSTTGKLYRNYSSQLASQSQQSIVYNRYRRLSSALTAFSTELIANARIRAEVADLNINSSLIANASVISARTKADLTSSSSISITAKRVRVSSAQLLTSFNLVVESIKIAQLSAALDCEGFVLSTGRKINLDASKIYIIPSENRIWRIQPEIRSWSLSNENRTWNIQSDSRDWIIPNEDRTYIIKE